MEIEIAKPSARVLGKMKRGMRVRVSGKKEGEEGMGLVVLPDKYSSMTRTFSRGAGLHLCLSPEELEHNKGRGLFGKIGKSLKKAGMEVLKETAGHAKKEARKHMTPEMLEHLNEETGQKMGALAKAVVGKAMADKVSAELEGKIQQKRGAKEISQIEEGKGLYAQVGRGRREMGSIGIHGNLLRGSGLPPALQSQPMSENFQFRHTLYGYGFR